MSDQEDTESLYSQSYDTHVFTPNDSWDGSCPVSPLFRQELQNWYITKETDGMLAGILVEDCLFYLEPHNVGSDEPGPTSIEAADLVAPSLGHDRPDKPNPRRITAAHRATDAPACPTIRDPLISISTKTPARYIRRSSPSNRPSAPPHLDFPERNNPFTRIGDGAESPRNQNRMEDDGGRSCSRQCPGRNEARSPRQKVWTGRAAEAQLDLSQARGIITRSAATTDGTLSSPLTRKSCAAQQDRKYLLSQEIRTSRVAACDNAEPGESRATVLALGAPTAPIVGYCPTGLHESTTPLGKYYPTNYEARKKTKRAVAERKAVSAMASVPTSAGASPTRPPPSAPLLPNSSSPSSDAIPAPSSPPQKRTSTPLMHSHGPPVIHVSRPTTVGRPVSEFSAVSSPLIQYKRDMVTQTVQKAKDVVRYAVTAGAQMDEKTQAQITRSLTLLSVCSKPKSPKIHPTIMSPGPVTPMTLDGDTETDYLTARPQNHQAA